jgi:hypothetical protein
MDTLPQLTPKQTEAVEALFVLYRQSRKDNPQARAAFLGVEAILMPHPVSFLIWRFTKIISVFWHSNSQNVARSM